MTWAFFDDNNLLVKHGKTKTVIAPAGTKPFNKGPVSGMAKNQPHFFTLDSAV
jgi:hypothetical protein